MIAIIFLIAYAVEKDEIVTLTTDENANLVEDGVTFLPEDLDEDSKEEGTAPASTLLFLFVLGIKIVGVIFLVIIFHLH